MNEGKYYLSAWGNENIIRNYIAHFEKKVVAEIKEIEGIEYDFSCAAFPNFAAWIRFYTELICNSLYWKLFRCEGDWKIIQSLSFREIRDRILEIIKKETESQANKIAKEELEAMKEAINIVLNLRHSFQHGGLPNIMRKISFKSDEEKLYGMLLPRNYKETKGIFLIAEKLIDLLPKPIISVWDDNMRKGVL